MSHRDEQAYKEATTGALKFHEISESHAFFPRDILDCFQKKQRNMGTCWNLDIANPPKGTPFAVW